MDFLRKYFIFLLSFVLLFSSVYGLQFNAGDIQLAENQTIYDDLYIAGEDIEIKSDVKGDLIVAGGDILISGDVDDDLTAAGGTINVKGTVKDDARIAGGEILVDSEIRDDLIVAGGNVIVSENSNIRGDLVVFSGTLLLNGDVKNNVIIKSGNVKINSKIDGNVSIEAGSIQILSGTVIKGDLDYKSQEKADIHEDAVIEGDVKYTEVKKTKADFRLISKTSRIIIGTLSLLLLGIISILLFPITMKDTAWTIKNSPWKSLGVGIVSIIIAPIAFILILLTIIGIPIAFIGLILFIMLSYVSRIFVALAIGSILISRKRVNKKDLLLMFIVGLIVLVILINLPFVGSLMHILAVLVGMGGFLIKAKLGTKSKKKSL